MTHEPHPVSPQAGNAPGNAPTPLAGVHVLDLTNELGVVGARTLASLGADVLRPELPQGDEVRSRPPLYTNKPWDAASDGPAHLVHNADKHSLILDWTDDAGRAELRTLIANSDIVLCSRGAAFLADIGIDVDSFAEHHPETTLVVLDPFPKDSPFSGEAYQDLTISAAAGFAWFCGSEEGPPEHPKGQMAYTYAGVSASLAALVGLVARDLRGTAGIYELNAQEAVAFSTAQSGDPNPLVWYGDLPGRIQWAGTAKRALQQCGDGNWVTFVMLGARFEALADWLSSAGISDEFLAPEWRDNEYYNEHLERLTEAIAKLCALYSRDEIVALGQQRSLMVMPIKNVAELLSDPQLAARDVFQPVQYGTDTVELPRLPMLFSQTPLRPPKPAPAPNEHDAGLLKQWHEPRESGTPPLHATQDALPLAGLRVADFSWMLAAPLATRFLADLGADVVRIESRMRRDMTREIGPQPPGYQNLDTNSTQHQASSNKRSLALDMRHPESVDIARRLIATSDIVLDNYRPGTMAKWGLGPDELLSEWPGLIVTTMPAVGSTGPHKHFGAIGNGVAGYGGINSLTGFAHNPPWGVGPIVADFFAPLFTVHGVLSAVHHRNTTGRGQHLDCSMLESTLWLLDTAFIENQLTGEIPERIGNRNKSMTPHGIFPCRGEEEWIAIAVETDEQWRTLCRIVEIPGHDRDRFARYAERHACESDVEALLGEATKRRSRWQLACALQRAGVPAAPVEHVHDHLHADSGMQNRFARVKHPYDIEFLVHNQFIRPRGATVPNRRAPMIGEHSDEILRELGLHESDITELFAKGIIN